MTGRGRRDGSSPGASRPAVSSVAEAHVVTFRTGAAPRGGRQLQRQRHLERPNPTQGWPSARRSSTGAPGGIEMALATPTERTGEGGSPPPVEAAGRGRRGPGRRLGRGPAHRRPPAVAAALRDVRLLVRHPGDLGRLRDLRPGAGQAHGRRGEQGPDDRDHREPRRADGARRAADRGRHQRLHVDALGPPEGVHPRRLGDGRGLPRRPRAHRNPQPRGGLGRPGAGDDADRRALPRPLPLPAVQLEHGPGPVPGLPARPRPGAPGRRGEHARRDHEAARPHRRRAHHDHARDRVRACGVSRSSSSASSS